jgi:competence protein ComEC
VRLKKGDAQEVGTGDTVRVRALVRPPMPPAYPGAWDLQRDAWYSSQGGSGYALGPIERIAETPANGMQHLVQRLREVIARHISAVVPGAADAVSITLLTGVSTGIPQPTTTFAPPASRICWRRGTHRHRDGLDAGIRPPRVRGIRACQPALADQGGWRPDGADGRRWLWCSPACTCRSFAASPWRAFTPSRCWPGSAISQRGLALAAIVLMLLEPQECLESRSR